MVSKRDLQASYDSFKREATRYGISEGPYGGVEYVDSHNEHWEAKERNRDLKAYEDALDTLIDLHGLYQDPEEYIGMQYRREQFVEDLKLAKAAKNKQAAEQETAEALKRLNVGK